MSKIKLTDHILKTKIREVFGNISNELYQNVWSLLEHRLDYLQANNEENVKGMTEILSKLRNKMCIRFKFNL